MAIFKRKKKIQATEGEVNQVTLESLLTGTRLSGAGTERLYKTYASQVSETYKKYEGRADLGCPQLRSLVDLRTALIAGEGVSVQAPNPATAKWLNDFITKNKLKGSKFFRMVKGGEMTGKALLLTDVYGQLTDNPYVGVYRLPYANGITGINYQVELVNKYDFESIRGLYRITKTNQKERLSYKNFKFIRLGGSDTDINETTTKIGMVLHECESYDRCLNGMRNNNHLFNKITPTFETKSNNDTEYLISWINRLKWKIGLVFAGTAKMEYKVPPTTTHENYKTELEALAQIISAVTGIPVHWLGFVGMMSNRATAEELYELLNTATSIERNTWAEGFYDICITAQELAIDRGFAPFKTIDRDYEVKIPLVSYTKLLNYIKALSLAYTDGAISLKGYRNKMPNVDPYQEEQNIKAEQDAAVDNFMTEIDEDLEDSHAGAK